MSYHLEYSFCGTVLRYEMLAVRNRQISNMVSGSNTYRRLDGNRYRPNQIEIEIVRLIVASFGISPSLLPPEYKVLSSLFLKYKHGRVYIKAHHNVSL